MSNNHRPNLVTLRKIEKWPTLATRTATSLSSLVCLMGSSKKFQRGMMYLTTLRLSDGRPEMGLLPLEMRECNGFNN